MILSMLKDLSGTLLNAHILKMAVLAWISLRPRIYKIKYQSGADKQLNNAHPETNNTVNWSIIIHNFEIKDSSD